MEKYHKCIIFCKTKLTGMFRYENEFQIYPADFPGMPKSSMQEHHPIVLEYVIHEDEKIVPQSDYDVLKDLRTLTASTLTKQDKIISLLTLFTNHNFFRYYDLTGTWGFPILKENAGEEMNTWSSKWNWAMFHWPEYPEQFKIKEFTEVGFSEVEIVNYWKYYFNEPNFDNYSDREITFPNIIYAGLNSYFKKSKEQKIVLDSAISFIVSAMELRMHRKTMSIIASFTAIETMVNFEFKDSKPLTCEKCNQPQYKVSEKYRNYLLKYIGDNANNKKKFNALYKFRSSIIHTGQKLKTENLYNDLTREEKDKEFLNHVEILQLSRLSVVNWLTINP